MLQTLQEFSYCRIKVWVLWRDKVIVLVWEVPQVLKPGCLWDRPAFSSYGFVCISVCFQVRTITCKAEHLCSWGKLGSSFYLCNWILLSVLLSQIFVFLFSVWENDYKSERWGERSRGAHCCPVWPSVQIQKGHWRFHRGVSQKRWNTSTSRSTHIPPPKNPLMLSSPSLSTISFKKITFIYFLDSVVAWLLILLQ